MVMVAPDSILPISSLFRTVLSSTTSLTVQGFQWLPQSSYPLVRWFKIFQVLELEALATPMLSLDGINKSKGEEENSHRRSLPMVEPDPNGLEETPDGEAIEWLKTCHARDLEENGFLRKDQKILMSSVINLQYTIGKGDRDCDGEEQVGTIWEGIRLYKHLSKQVFSWSRQAKEVVDKIKERDLTETDFIKA